MNSVEQIVCTKGWMFDESSYPSVVKDLNVLCGLVGMYSSVLLAVIFRGIRLTPRKLTKTLTILISRSLYDAAFTQKFSRHGGASLYSKLHHSRA